MQHLKSPHSEQNPQYQGPLLAVFLLSGGSAWSNFGRAEPRPPDFAKKAHFFKGVREKIKSKILLQF